MDQEYVKLVYYRDFGDMLSQKRKAVGMSIREVSGNVGFDYSNWSKIEQGKLMPPDDMPTLSKWAVVLGMEKNSNEYFQFIDWAYLTRGEIPPDMPIPRLLRSLPALFRNIRNYKPLRMKDIDPNDI